jgi:hypothetical protein
MPIKNNIQLPQPLREDIKAPFRAKDRSIILVPGYVVNI